MRQTGYLPRPPTSTQAPEILHAGSCPGSSYIYNYFPDNTASFMKIGRGISELWRVENRPLPLTWPMAYTTANYVKVVNVEKLNSLRLLYYRTSRDQQYSDATQRLWRASKHPCKRTAIYAVLQAKLTKQHNTAVNVNSKTVHRQLHRHSVV